MSPGGDRGHLCCRVKPWSFVAAGGHRMKESGDKLFGIAEKIKTPLALAGLVVIVLYLLVKQVLALDVFSNIGGSGTLRVLENVLDSVFWLATIAVVLGVGSYVVA